MKLLSNPEVQLKIRDFIQETSGNVNRDNLTQAIEKACSSCTRNNFHDQARVSAFLTALYMQNDIRRAAQVGGSLRKRFGVTWFPHIKERELRYAIDVDKELEDFFYQELTKKSR
ncbi:hypothetical protein [Anabaena sp. 4-3]|uniref:hypothetical protein n=1 Tax=Anabaena sp. 4-3 TaxID=1811979 RepID=UPI0012E7BFC0|nr:hypothetical protein [Anabaena sp. 4-3]